MSTRKMNKDESIGDKSFPEIDKNGGNRIYISNIPLVILLTIAVIFFLSWAQVFFITVLLGIFTAYSLNPFVSFLEKAHLPRVLSSTLVITALIISFGAGSYALKGQVESIISQLPAVSKKITSLVTNNRNSTTLSNIQKVQIAATQVENAAAIGDSKAKKNVAIQVEVKEHKFKLSDFLWKGSLQIGNVFGLFITVVTLAYFLLNSGDLFKRKLVKLAGPTVSNKKITINILQDINQSIQGYVLMQLVTNSLAGLFTWLALRMIGLENAGAWGVAAGLLHAVPYFGPLIATIAPAIAAYMQFDSVGVAMTVVLISLLIGTLVGVLLSTWMTGRFAKMNSPAVFISLIFFTWLWGFWGMILGIPIVAIIKVISDRIDYLQPLAEILGE